MKRLIAIIAFFCLTGCNPTKNFAVVEAGMPTLNGLKSLHGRATVENSGGRDLVISNARFVVHYRDRTLGTARLMRPITLPSGSTTPTRYDLALDDFTLSDMQILSTRILTNPDALTLDGEIWVKWGVWQKKIEVKEVDGEQLIKIIYTFAQ
jgi:hypothetical protein